MKRWFRSLRIHILLPVLIMTLLLVILMTTLVSRAYIGMNLKQESEKNAAFFQAIAQVMNRTVTQSIADTREIMADDRIAKYAQHPFRTDAELIHARVDCMDYLRTEINRHSAIYGLLFMRPDGSLFGALPYSNAFKDDRKDVPLPDAVIDQVLDIPSGQTVWIGPLSGSEVYGFKNSKLPETIAIAAWRSVSVESGECYALMLMDEAVFEEMLTLLPDAASTVHVFSANGGEFFRMGNDDSGFDRETLLSEENNGRIVKNNRNQAYGIFSMPLAAGGASSASGWMLVREVSMEDSRQSIRSLQRMVWILAFMALLAAFGIYYLWLKSFMRSFNALKNDIIRIGKGNLELISDEAASIEEFESMRRELNNMGQLLGRHMETIRQMEREKLEQEMNDLHSILAPHMIFNSITAIRWMATFMGAESVSDMLVELGEVIRPVLREWRVQWTIREELEHISHYTRLMDLRYANNFRLEYQIPEALNNELILQFTLQPLIENAAQHGGHPEGPLLVTVRVTDEGDWISMMIADNGNTIRPEKIEEIQETLRAGKRDHGIGLINVYSRLVLCKGKDSTLDIEALPEGGTMVTLRWRRDVKSGDEKIITHNGTG